MHSLFGGLRAEGHGLTIPSGEVDIEIPLETAPVYEILPEPLPDPSRKVISFAQMMTMLEADKHSIPKRSEGIPKKAPGGAAVPNLNPKAGVGSQKLPMHLVSPLASAYMAVGLANGAGKYGAGNYKGTEILLSIYLAATLRHLYAFMEGEEFDAVDGTPHLGAIMANMAIIVDARAVGTLVDDRIIAGGYLKEIEALTKIYQGLLELHKDRNPFHFTRNNLDT